MIVSCDDTAWMETERLMRLALLGLDDTTLALARAAIESGDRIVMLCDVDASRLSALGLGSTFGRIEPWETLLDGGVNRACDAVLVARDEQEELRLEQLRKLVQAGMPMLVSHPIHRSMLAYYELDMIRREAGTAMIPWLPLRWHPLVRRMRDLIHAGDGGPLGAISQIVIERSLADRGKRNVLHHFAQDVDCLQVLGGDVIRLGAMGSPGISPAGEYSAYNNLGVQMTGEGDLLLRWSVAPLAQREGARIVATGSKSRAVLEIAGATEVEQLEVRGAGPAEVVRAENWDAEEGALAQLRQAIAGEENESLWPAAARAVELAETIDRSLAKGRTIELHDEEYSDISTFKGTMTSVGCGLLLFALVAIVGGALAAAMLKQAGFHQAAQVVGLVPYGLLAVFLGFLLVQAVLKLVAPGGTEGEKGRWGEGESGSDESVRR